MYRIDIIGSKEQIKCFVKEMMNHCFTLFVQRGPFDQNNNPAYPYN